jgi:hypothetical protein
MMDKKLLQHQLLLLPFSKELLQHQLLDMMDKLLDCNETLAMRVSMH